MEKKMIQVSFGTRIFETDLVIFDKDGTLIDFKSTWLPVLEQRITLILERIGPDYPADLIRDDLYRVHGVTNGDGKSVTIDPYGPFAHSSLREDEVIIAGTLYQHGIPWRLAKMIARETAHDTEKVLNRSKSARIIPGAKETLKSLKQSGVSLAVATADITELAAATLSHLGIGELFDIVIGSDMVKEDKPHPEMLLTVIDRVGTSAEKTAFVGDTITDMEMGKKAGVGLVVGAIEGGITPREYIAELADVVIDTVKDIRVC
jgi:phosphoglycolate phosphatase